MDKVKIYCPMCGRYVFSTWKKTTMSIPSKCKKCNKLVVYNGETGFTHTRDIPERHTSSGTVLY